LDVNIDLTFKRLAIDKEPESCGCIRNGALEALTGLNAGQVLSPESMSNPGADAVRLRGRQHSMVRNGENRRSQAGSETLSMHSFNLRENREIPWLAAGATPVARIVKSKDARR
jgi:hypothetical protein